MSKRKLDKTDIGEMHCWANSAFHSGFLKVEIDSDHATELCERALDNNRLTEENAKLRYHLESMVGESIYLAKFKNEALKRSICSTDLDEPEWHDYQAIAEAANLLNQLNEQNDDK